jgi:alanine transaminase
VTAFICLQAELPPQADLPVGGVGGFLPYRPTVTLMASARSGPPSLEVMDGLRNPYLDKFLPDRRKADRHAGDPAHVAAQAERARVTVDFGHCPIPDLGVPSVEALEGVVGDVIDRLKAGQVVYLHCWGGRGRAGTVGACVIGRLYGLGADEALERTDRALSTREPGGQSPETAEQRALVAEFLGKA